MSEDKETKKSVNKKKYILLFMWSLIFLVVIAGVLFGPMNLKLTSCKGEKKGLCVAPARTVGPARVDWNKKVEVMKEQKND